MDTENRRVVEKLHSQSSADPFLHLILDSKKKSALPTEEIHTLVNMSSSGGNWNVALELALDQHYFKFPYSIFKGTSFLLLKNPLMTGL